MAGKGGAPCLKDASPFVEAVPEPDGRPGMEQRYGMLHKLRVLFASLSLGGFLLLFLARETPPGFPGAELLAKIQLVPALLAGSVITVGALILLTLLFGRVYCSVVCPLGVLQDVVSKAARKRRFRFMPAPSGIRAAALIVFIAAFLAGIPVLFSALEPYSMFGRMAANAGAMTRALWNFLSGAETARGWNAGFASLVAATATFAVIGFMAWKKGRLWCNTFCPVGTVLGQFARVSLFRIAFVPTNCVRCGLCEKACRASCLDVGSRTVDGSRCVACFRCLDACRHQGITYAASGIKPLMRNGVLPSGTADDTIRQ